MNRQVGARVVLAADAIGCLAAAGVVISSDSLVREVDQTAGSRWPIVLALGITSLSCAAGAIQKAPSNAALSRSALLNAGWVAVCLGTFRTRPSRLGAQFVLATGVLDAVAAGLQWGLRRRS